MADWIVVLCVLGGLLVAWQAVELLRASRERKRLSASHEHLPPETRKHPRAEQARRTTSGRFRSRF